MTTLQDVMTPDVITASPNEGLQSMAQKMEAHDVGILPIVNDEQLLGVVTDRDIVVKGLAKDFKSNGVEAEKIMNDSIVTGYPDMEIEEASRLMQDHQIHRLLVVEDHKLQGVVSIGDLAVSKNADQAAGNAMSEIKKENQ